MSSRDYNSTSFANESHTSWLLTLLFFFAVSILSSVTLASAALAKPFADDAVVIRFDAGPPDALVEECSVGLHPNSAYLPESGFGWTRSPTSALLRTELSRSRNAFTIDGVTGKHLAFRVDVIPGDWQVTVWLDVGPADKLQLRVLTQGKVRELGWQRFTPPSEPKQSLPKTYRVFHAATPIDAGGFSLELIGNEQEVRLLGISLVRKSPAATPAHQEFWARLEAAGRHGSSASLSDLWQQADNARLQNPSDACFAAWQEQLALLVEAERLFQMRGWEWANERTGLGMFDRLYQAVMLVDGLLGEEGAATNPLTERALYLRGRILYWLNRERAGADERAGAVRDLGKLYANYPQDKTLAMYAGEKIDLPDACDHLEAADNAPAWSVAQREALCRMRQICHWWVQQQQADNGEFGGKLGDDVELLRWWAPLVLVGDKIALEGWRKLADGVWESELIRDGYAAKLSDVEHAAEFIADTASLMAITSDDPRYQQRLVPTAKHFGSLWTGVTSQEHRFFRSAWFSSTEIETRKPKGRDLEYNTRAVQPMRYLAWRRQSPEVVALLHQWSLAWVSAALRTDKGKPKGIIPPSVRFEDESINGDEPTWYLPNMYWKYYDWDHYTGSLMLDQLLLTYSLTQDERLLRPMMLTLSLIQTEEAGLVRSNQAPPKAGTRAWAAAKLMKSKMFWQVVQQWRFMTNDSQWDELILRHGTPYGRYRLSGAEHHLVNGLNELLEGVRYNTPLKTTEAIHTDRVYVPRAELLKAMLTGDGVKYNVSPYYAVSWEETDEHFTALVGEAGRDRLEVQLFSHAPEDGQIIMRLWQLAPGTYRLRLEPQRLEPQERLITVQKRGERIRIELPGQRLLRVSLEPTHRD